MQRHEASRRNATSARRTHSNVRIKRSPESNTWARERFDMRMQTRPSGAETARGRRRRSCAPRTGTASDAASDVTSDATSIRVPTTSRRRRLQRATGASSTMRPGRRGGR
ncbi:hypothetical protein NW94_16300 [Burkholderia mallei]|nr:hypothetical protein ACT79_07515 [Burkholderia pseudomallei]ATD95334.1 hypothetical protein NW91_16085 [Burkholderia mallei]ATE00167.1 hypothetical protein NW92_16560 [Burkholderia mallei]ATE05087.1 hypothetical protein NW93_16850 [Burkholderia mallei]ATE09901.1 hypothetical protein NW94_16300 [Burkholderia mallei]